MTTNVYTMRAPASPPGSVFAFPSQLHPFVPPIPPRGGGGQPHVTRRDPHVDFETEYRKRREREDIEALIALGAL